MNHTLVDIYESYSEEIGEVDRDTFRALCTEFNLGLIDYLLTGREINLGSHLSTLRVYRMERNPLNRTIDWGESNKYKQELLDAGEKLYDKETGEGVKWHIYYTDGSYCKYHWNKHKCQLKNKSVYRFDPTRGLKGNKEKLTALLKEDELAYLRFKKYGNL